MIRKSLLLIFLVNTAARTERPPGLGIPYGNDVVGHGEDLSEYNNDEEFYYEEYEDGEDSEYYEDYYEEDGEETKESNEEYYDYDYLQENTDNAVDHVDNEEEEYEYYREDDVGDDADHDGVLKLADNSTDSYEEDYDEYYEDYHEEDYSSQNYSQEEEDVEEDTTESAVSEHNSDDSHSMVSHHENSQTTPPSLDYNLPTDDEDFSQGSGDHVFTTTTTMSTTISTTTTTTPTTTTTTATTTTSTESTTLISSGDESGDYYFDEEDDHSSGSGSQPTVSSVTEKIEYFTTTRAVVSEGSGSDHVDQQDNEVLIKPKDYLDTTDDEDFSEGSGNTPDIDESALNEDVDEEYSDGEQTEEETSDSDSDHLTEEQSRIRSDFFSLHGLDLLSLDLTCMQNFVSGPDIPGGHLVQYQYGGLGTGRQYAEAVYGCDDGYKLKDEKISSLFCQNGTWKGEMPRCLAVLGETVLGEREWCEEQGRCDQLCYLEEGAELCACYPGYTLSSDSTSCQDIDECEANNGGCDQICHNRPGTFMCECQTGFSGSITCLDINECLLNNGHGPCQDSCSNTEGGYQCSCENLAGTVLGEDNHTCQAGGGCSNNNGGCSHQCIDSYNQVFCMCPDGFLLGSDWATCEDVDECDYDDMGCDQLCINTPGSYQCGCQTGYSLLADGGCEDINECTEETSGCSHSCTNLPGSSQCSCPEGLSLSDSDGKTCEDIDECSLDNGLCQQICINKRGGVECGCRAGFRLQEDGRTCLDVDECEVEDFCGHGDCLNLEGSHTCSCHQGYSGQHLCQDINECQDSENPCGSVGECVNTPGSYECFCQPGYSFDGVSCFDLDECLIGNPCVNGNCTNKEGGYSCHCHPGYLEEEGVCLDINECTALSQSPCGVGRCVNTEGGYQCQCPPGYQHRHGGCHDQDECLDNICGDHSDCLNLPGSHQCQCHPGFVLREGRCEDVDECQASPCEGGRCLNVPGSFQCSCHPGFQLDSSGRQCEDQDECRLDNGGCSQLCLNTPGHRQCRCRAGYECVDEECRQCVDIDECAEASKGGCDQTCLNSQGSYQCQCGQGYQLTPDNHTCGDLNECTRNNGDCSHICQNTRGGHLCQCPPDWTLGPDGLKCQEEVRSCQPLRRPKFGFFRCTTKRERPGYRLGSRCRLKCRRGYRPVSGARKLCGEDGSWTGGQGECQPIQCPRIQPPLHGAVSPTSCSVSASDVNTRCQFSCSEGYNLSGSDSAVCSHTQHWKYSAGGGGGGGGPPSCQQPHYPPPFILCPPDLVKPLPPGSASVYVMLTQPKTNVDWFRYVTAEPKWAKQLEAEMKLGKFKLTFTAASPVGNKTASCSMTIHIKDTEPPRVVKCPQSFQEPLARGQMLKKVSWTEPVFKDNVGVHQMTASYLPGHYFPEGKHHVLYQAADADGNRARCGFTITVKRERSPPSSTARPQSVLQLPPPNLGHHRPSPQSPFPHCNKVPEVPNGKMSCTARRDSLKCSPVCEAGHVFYQKFSSRPPSYICSQYRVDWKITKFIPDCSPLEKTARPGNCPPGWEARENYCVACPPGMFRDSAPLCQLCGKGSYADTFGSSKCVSCPAGQRTNSLGVRSGRGCRAPAHSVASRVSGWRRRSQTSHGAFNRNQFSTTARPTARPTVRSTTTARSQRGGNHGRTGTGLTHYNSWLREQPQLGDHENRFSEQRHNGLGHHRDRRFRKHRRH